MARAAQRGRARRGDVRLAILSLLSDAPSNGYGLIKAIAERTDGTGEADQCPRHAARPRRLLRRAPLAVALGLGLEDRMAPVNTTSAALIRADSFAARSGGAKRKADSSSMQS